MSSYSMPASNQILIHFNSNINNINKIDLLKRRDIYLICKEAINNAVKYSEATEIKINISKTNNQIHFEIIDNGNGFVEQEVEPGNGLLNMRKRALELGNELIINSEKGKGTTIKF